MNNVTVAVGVLVAVVIGIGAGLGVSTLTDDNTCYEQAIALADTAVTTTDDFAEATFDSLERILVGVPVNDREFERIGEQHRENTDTLEELQESCG